MQIDCYGFEAISFEDVDEDVFKCEIGVNVYAFSSTPGYSLRKYANTAKQHRYR